MLLSYSRAWKITEFVMQNNDIAGNKPNLFVLIASVEERYTTLDTLCPPHVIQSIHVHYTTYAWKKLSNATRDTPIDSV